MKREYSSASLWSTVRDRVVIPVPIAEYIESFGDLSDNKNKAWLVKRIADTGFGHLPEDRHGADWTFSEDHPKYRNMFSSSDHKFDILNAAINGYLVHAPQVAVKFGKKFVSSLESETDYPLSINQWTTYQEDMYGRKKSYTLTLSDYPEPWNYNDALRLSEDFGGEIVKYG